MPAAMNISRSNWMSTLTVYRTTENVTLALYRPGAREIAPQVTQAA